MYFVISSKNILSNFPNMWIFTHTKIAVLVSIFVSTLTYTKTAERKHNLQTKSMQTIDQNGFKSYMKQYDPVQISENIETLRKKRGRNFTRQEYFDMVFKGIDISADIMKLKVQNGNPKIISAARRSFSVPNGLSIYPYDRFTLRPRLYELMKQAIYQARNKMVLMQIMREKYLNQSLYKMGYLMSKVDNAGKTFSMVSFRAFRGCGMARSNTINKYFLYDVLYSHERLLHLWFQIDLLKALLIRNDIEHHEAYEKREQWKFID